MTSTLSLPFSQFLRIFTPKPKTLCSWCLAEQGIPPSSGDSHGICLRHAAQVRRQMEELLREREAAARI